MGESLRKREKVSTVIVGNVASNFTKQSLSCFILTSLLPKASSNIANFPFCITFDIKKLYKLAKIQSLNGRNFRKIKFSMKCNFY